MASEPKRGRLMPSVAQLALDQRASV